MAFVVPYKACFVDDCFLGVGAVCCRPWKCAFERAPEMAGDDICMQYQSSGFRRIYCKICHALWSTRIENYWLMINNDPYDFRYCGRWSTNYCGSIILSTALRLSKIVKKWWSQLVRTARMLASVWHESGIFKLVHWWCTLYIVHRVWQVWGSSDCLFVSVSWKFANWPTNILYTVELLGVTCDR